jgi:hypothetical protein
MPLALDPNATLRIVLQSDLQKVEKERPYFLFRHLSCRQWSELIKKIDAIDESATGDKAMARLFDILKWGLITWGNMLDPATGREIAFDAAYLDRLLTLPEIWELIFRWRNQGVEVADLKKSVSQSPSATDRSAGNAPAERRAGTDRRPSRRRKSPA